MKRDLAIIGVAMELGQRRRGVSMGAESIRDAGLVDRLEKSRYKIRDLGDIHLAQTNTNEAELTGKLRNLAGVVSMNERLARKVAQEAAAGHFPLVLGGDHSIAIGTIAGLSEHYENLGVIWIDAHADMNTEETTPSGNIHGMPLAVSLGLGNEQLTSIMKQGPKIKPENIVLIGIRDLDEGEKQLIKQLNIKIYTMHEVDRFGMDRIMEETIAYLKDKTDGVHLSFDVDGVDPSEAPAVGTPVAGGLTFRESRLALEILAEENIITSAEFVEVNPLLDKNNKTSELVLNLIGALFGERVI